MFSKTATEFLINRATKTDVIIITLVVSFIAGLFYYQGVRISRARWSVMHSYEVRSHIQAVYTTIKELETGERDYLLTGNPAFMAPFQNSLHPETAAPAGGRESLLGEIQEVRNLVGDDAHQQSELSSLERLVRQRIDHANFTVGLFQEKGRDAAAQELNSRAGPALTDSIHGVINDMLAEESSMFKTHQELEQRRWQRDEVLFGGGLLFFYLGLLVTVELAARNRRRRQQAELTLHEREVLIQAIMDGGKHAMYATDRNGIINLYNRATERLMGYSSQDFFGQHVSKLIDTVFDAAELEDCARKLGMKIGRPVRPHDIYMEALKEWGFFEHEWTVLRKDGSKTPVSLTVTALKDDDGEVYGYLRIAQDISERKEVERAKNEFISTVSHELRTPLTSIRGSLGLIASGTLGALPGKVTELVHIAHKNSERLVLIINDILDVEKIESGKLHMRIRHVEVASLLNQALEANQAYAERFGVRLVLKSAPRHISISADPERLMQVLANLLSNASKFSPHGAEVWISARADFRDGRVYFSVQDFGAGIPEAFRHSVFEKFAQADPSATRSHEGTGLGLSIARKLLDAMEGSISFETQSGKGTTFFFDLPQVVA